MRRFRLRVLAKRFGKSFTATKLSPKIGPPGSGPGAGPATRRRARRRRSLHGGRHARRRRTPTRTACPTRSRLASRPIPCKLDTDGDGVSDGFEYESALDLNSRALPYAGKKPYPNPLDGSDAG